MKKSVLILDDDRAMCELFAEELLRRGFEVDWFLSPQEALTALQDCRWDAVLSDIKLPEMDGVQVCRRVTELCPGLPVLLTTAFGSMDTAIAAIRAGAYDFVTKPVDWDLLTIALERAVTHQHLRKKVQRLSEELSHSRGCEELVGESEVMHRLFENINRLADTDISVLISGESGTGKELVARALHRKSRRQNGPFVVLNCAAIPESLLESELFGYKKGAFTDATSDHDGVFLQAQHGTLFLDEIGDFPLALQSKLLRVLEAHAVRPLGSDREIAFDVRILAASHRDLEGAVQKQLFREDLYYRLNVVQVKVPPLHARETDILLLAQYFFEKAVDRSGKKVSGITHKAAVKMLDYPWPGNVRELRNAMEHAVALTGHDQLLPEDLPAKILAYKNDAIDPVNGAQGTLRTLAEVEHIHIQRVLKAVDGNRTQAAQILGLSRKALYNKLQSDK